MFCVARLFPQAVHFREIFKQILIKICHSNTLINTLVSDSCLKLPLFRNERHSIPTSSHKLLPSRTLPLTIIFFAVVTACFCYNNQQYCTFFVQILHNAFVPISRKQVVSNLSFQCLCKLERCSFKAHDLAFRFLEKFIKRLISSKNFLLTHHGLHCNVEQSAKNRNNLMTIIDN